MSNETPYTLRICGKWDSNVSPYEKDSLPLLRQKYHQPGALFFSLGEANGILVTDIPGKCMSLQRYQQAIEKAYENNAEGLSRKLTELRLHEKNGNCWVYVGEKAQAILFHNNYVVHAHAKMKLVEVGSLAKQGELEMV